MMIEVACESKEIYQNAINFYGEDNQLDMAVEEMSELTKEICKNKRGFDNQEEITEEIADVLIMIEQLTMIFNIKTDSITLEMIKKQNRLKERLREANGNM